MKSIPNVNSLLKRCSIIYLALFSKPFLLLLFLYATDSVEGFLFRFKLDFLTSLIFLFTLSGMFFGNLIFNKMGLQITQDQELLKKLNQFLKASIIQVALLEVPVIASLIAFVLRENFLYLIISISILAYLLNKYPRMDKIVAFCKPNPLQMRFFVSGDLPLHSK